jgi:hypothetical protein
MSLRSPMYPCSSLLECIVSISRTGEDDKILAVREASQFAGEMLVISGKRSLLKASVTDTGSVLELSREKVTCLMAKDSELGEIFMEAFVARRLELMERLAVRNSEIPVVYCSNRYVLRNPSIAELTQCLDLNINTDKSVRDVVVVGAGPAGLAAAVYAASGLEETKSSPICHVFVMAGAAPRTEWLEDSFVLNNRGFIVTGPDLASFGDGDQWPLKRPPLMLETNVPGIFAVGDTRAGSIKRVASAVGEGSMAVHLVHRYLAERAEQHASPQQAQIRPASAAV